MSSNIEISLKCTFCNGDFLARTTKTKYCSRACNGKHYKKLKQDELIAATVNEKLSKVVQVDMEKLASRNYLNINEASKYLGISISGFYRIRKSGVVYELKVGQRTLFRRVDLDVFMDRNIKKL